MRVKCIYPVLLVNLCLGYGNCTSTINEENNKTKHDFNIIEWYIMMSIFRFGQVLDNITALQNLNVYEFRTLVLVFTGVIWMFWKGWWPMVHILCKVNDPCLVSCFAIADTLIHLVQWSVNAFLLHAMECVHCSGITYISDFLFYLPWLSS